MHQTGDRRRWASERLRPAPPSRLVAGQRTSAIGRRPELPMKDEGIRAVLYTWSEPQEDFSHHHTTNLVRDASLLMRVRRQELSHISLRTDVVPMSSVALARYLVRRTQKFVQRFCNLSCCRGREPLA